MSAVHRYQNHVRIARDILMSRPIGKPFHVHLSGIFKTNKKYGSKDRRSLKDLCYGYFRLGHHLPLKIEDALHAWIYVEGYSAPPILDFVKEELGLTPFETRKERIEAVLHGHGLEINHMHSWQEFVSKEVNASAVAKQLWYKPRTWLRSNPQKENDVAEYLQKLGLSVEHPFECCFGIAGDVHLAQHKILRNHVEVQDRSSQWVVKRVRKHLKGPLWDACAASGGKTLAVHSWFPQMKIWATDKRASILKNLKRRTEVQGLQLKMGLVDLSKPVNTLSIGGEQVDKEMFRTIWVDAPCTGSGTWARNPEGALDYKEESLEKYVTLQESIVQHALPFLKDDGKVVYTTCSVFEKENEGHLAYFDSLGLTCIESGYVEGSAHSCDSMFYSVYARKK